MAQLAALDLRTTFLRLRPDASVEPLPVDAGFWPRLARGELGNFRHEFLVATAAYDADWPMQEMHPHGDEIVYLLAGAAVFVLHEPTGPREVELREAGEYVLVPKGTWHTAKIRQSCKLLFITAGEGTQHRSPG